MDNYVITITRQFGSLGRLVGKEVSELMKFAYYDRDILENASPLVGDNIETLAKYDGHDYSPFTKMMHPLGYGNSSLQEKLFEVEKSLIIEHADYENCVIIGRCADYILKGRPNVLSVYIYAPFDERLKFCMKDLRLSEEEAIRYMTSVDKARENFYKKITRSRFDSLDNRHFMIDSSVLGVKGTAEVIKDVAIRKFGL